MTLEEAENLRVNPKNWKWGVVYFCPQDPRWIVPKKITSTGWTYNFAHRGSYGWVSGCLVFVGGSAIGIFLCGPSTPFKVFGLFGVIALTVLGTLFAEQWQNTRLFGERNI
ncbi:MAG: DUF5808 domain-containing protein [Candidatus Omnitrophica bacterium]|nr:DUF5808 domain-containing protein [Candidatus Omnitrophota bacterium]